MISVTKSNFINEVADVAVIENMMKVEVAVRAGRTETEYDLVSEPAAFVFIFGAGSEGLCGFESLLFGKKTGDSMTLSVSGAELHETFGHLLGPLFGGLGLKKGQCPLFFEITVKAVAVADSRELVQSIARAVASGGCGGGCGCGCD